jgi:hypothetical protein
MGIFPSNAEQGKAVNTFPGRLNSYIASIAEALGIALDTVFSGKQVVKQSDVGAPNGVAPLDSQGKIPNSYLNVSQTAAAGKIPVANASGVLDPSWFPPRSLPLSHWFMYSSSGSSGQTLDFSISSTSVVYNENGFGLTNGSNYFVVPSNKLFLLIVWAKVVSNSASRSLYRVWYNVPSFGTPTIDLEASSSMAYDTQTLTHTLPIQGSSYNIIPKIDLFGSLNISQLAFWALRLK